MERAEPHGDERGPTVRGDVSVWRGRAAGGEVRGTGNDERRDNVLQPVLVIADDGDERDAGEQAYLRGDEPGRDEASPKG